MKLTFTLFSCVILCLLFVTQSAADPGNGAIVVRESGEYLYWYWEYGGEDILLLGGSSEDALEGFHCGIPPEGDIFPIYDKAVFQPNGKVKLLEKASAYVRVFSPATPDDFFADPCLFLSQGPQVAEGIGDFIYTDNNLFAEGTGRFNWGYRERGALYDLAGLCPNEIIHYLIVRRFQLAKNADYPDCLPDCLEVKVSKGPQLTCKAY